MKTKLPTSAWGHGIMHAVSGYLLKERFANNLICPCIFIKKSETRFEIIAMYIDDLNLVGTLKELTKTTKYLKNELEMKDLRKTKFCLDLQIEYFPTGVLVHRYAYTKKILTCFYMDKAHPLSFPMVIHSLDLKNDQFCSFEKGKELLGLEVPYLSVISTLMYLANYTRPYIDFFCQFISQTQFRSNPKILE